jgi:hypothetical protein
LRVASQMMDERQVYLVDVESSKENWVSEGSIWRRWVEKVSGSPSSNRKVVRGGPLGGWWCVGRGGCQPRERRREEHGQLRRGELPRSGG